MSELQGLTVREILPHKFEQIEQAVKQEMVTGTGSSQTTGMPEFFWQVVAGKASDAIREVLNFDVLQVLARGWCLAREIEAQAALSKQRPKKRFAVFVGEHKLPVELHPVLIITISQFGERQLRFTLELTALVHSIRLLIRNGHLTGVEAGDYQVSAQLKYGQVNLHNEVKWTKTKFPGIYNFAAPGIPIGG